MVPFKPVTIPLTRTAPPRLPCLTISSATSTAPRHRRVFCFSLLGFKPKCFHFLKPCSSLREIKKPQQQTLSKIPNTAPQSLRRFLNFNPRSENDEQRDGDAAERGSGDDTAVKGTILAGILLLGVGGGFGAVGYAYRDQINVFLTQFSGFIEAGYAIFVAVYAGLEILAIPAIPLTMSAGLLFGTVTGTILVSISGTIAASTAFLIARYFARDRILKLVEGNKKFVAIDKAIGENGFKLVRYTPWIMGVRECGCIWPSNNSRGI